MTDYTHKLTLIEEQVTTDLSLLKERVMTDLTYARVTRFKQYHRALIKSGSESPLYSKTYGGHMYNVWNNTYYDI